MSSLYYNLVELAPAVMELMAELVENDMAHNTFNMDLIIMTWKKKKKNTFFSESSSMLNFKISYSCFISMLSKGLACFDKLCY